MRIIAGKFKGRVLNTVQGPGYRPAMGKVRESLFSILESRFLTDQGCTGWAGMRVLDLFAGSGSLGFEALSRGAKEACFVEKDPKAAACLRKNAEHMGATECKVWADDVAKVLGKRCAQPFHLVFIDPPYGQQRFEPSMNALLRNGWLCPGALVTAEVELSLKIDPSMVGLEFVTERLYGQTRILLWSNALPSTPELSTL